MFCIALLSRCFHNQSRHMLCSRSWILASGWLLYSRLGKKMFKQFQPLVYAGKSSPNHSYHMINHHYTSHHSPSWFTINDHYSPTDASVPPQLSQLAQAAVRLPPCASCWTSSRDPNGGTVTHDWWLMMNNDGLKWCLKWCCITVWWFMLKMMLYDGLWWLK